MSTKPITSLDYITSGRVTPNDFQKVKYNINNYSYPNDLFGENFVNINQVEPNNEYGKNYVIFFINVSEDSKIVKSVHSPDMISNKDMSPRNTADIIGQNVEAGVTKETAIGAAAGVGVVSDILANTVGIPIGGVGTKGGIVAAGALYATGDKIGSFTRPQKRLQTAIALHVPNQLSIRYGIDWNDESNALFSYATVAGKEFENMVKTFTDFQGNKPSSLSSIAQNILAANVLNASSGLSASTGLANNPMKEQIFNGVGFRTFQMEYQFFPRSEDEAKNVLDIIQQFKYHAHPEFKDKNSFIYIYPSEFDIAYYHGSEENTTIHRHTSCVLQNIGLNYTPNGSFTTFRNGMPTQINMSLDFVELARLTKDKIREGF